MDGIPFLVMGMHLGLGLAIAASGTAGGGGDVTAVSAEPVGTVDPLVPDVAASVQVELAVAVHPIGEVLLVATGDGRAGLGERGLALVAAGA